MVVEAGPAGGGSRGGGSASAGNRTPPPHYGSTCGANGTAACAVPACPNVELIDEGPCGSPGVPVDPSELAREALASLDLPAPVIGMAPPPGDLVVRLAAWLWVEGWGSLSATASVPGVAATATARPYRVVWEMGDGATVACEGPGVPWREGVREEDQSTYCSYAYPRSSAGQPSDQYVVRAWFEFTASWVAVGAPGGGSLGVVRGPVSSVAVSVGEVQAIVTQ